MAPDKNTTVSKSKETKSSSVPSTPQLNQKHKRISSSSEALERNIHSSNTTTVVTSQEKHIPNYLRPTISSVKSSSKNQSESSTTLPSVTNKRPVNKHLTPPRKLPNSTLPRSPRSSPARTQVHRKPAVHKGLSKGTKKQLGASKSVQNNNTAHEDEAQEVCTDNESKSNDEKREEQLFHYDASEESLGGGDEMTSDDGSSVRSRMTENGFKKVECEEENKEVVNIDCEGKNKDEEAGTDVADHVMDVESSETDNASETVIEEWCEEKKEVVEHAATDVKNSNVEEKERLNANNAVIEETASKLAEKKNKVLALAGAFETVISLQEPKGQPSPKKVHENQHKDERKESIVNMHEEGDDKFEEEIEVNKQRCEEEEEGNSSGEVTEMNMCSDEKENDAEEKKSASAETKEENTKENESA